MEEKELHTDWRNELNKTAFKYHSLVLWVALILNPVWAIGDYFTIPEHFVDFLVFRLVVSVACLLAYIFRNKFIEKPWVLAFIPFIGIAVQNAYMYSVMEIPELAKHTFAFIALFIGAGMFVLWSPVYSIIIALATIITSIIFFSLLSPLELGDILINGGMLTFTVAIFTILLIDTRTRLTKKEIISRLALAESNKKLIEQKKEIEEKNKDIRDSIQYAQRIQHAILPKIEFIEQSLSNYFIHYAPKDIVSGDFYWMANVTTTPADGSVGERIVVMAVVDCTGHGVPGALMSIIGSTILNQSVTSAAVNSPAEALDFLNRELKNNLKDIRDGMDMSLVAINFNSRVLQYAGANNSVFIVRNGEIMELKPDKRSIGSSAHLDNENKFTNQSFQLHLGDMVYMFTDGYSDQFGNPAEAKQRATEILNNPDSSEEEINNVIMSMLKGKKFGNRRFQMLLSDISSLPMAEQKERLERVHHQWRGDLEQVDDICVLGIKI